jgi:hypothetical protein
MGYKKMAKTEYGKYVINAPIFKEDDRQSKNLPRVTFRGKSPGVTGEILIFRLTTGA